MLQRLSAALVAFKFKAAGAISRTLYEKMADKGVSAADFGLKQSNTGEANTAAMNAAVEFAISSGINTVYVPSGTYNITEMRYSPRKRGFTLRGSGRESTTFIFTKEGGKFQINTVDKYSDYAHIEDMTIDGNGLAVGAYIFTNYTNCTSVIFRSFQDYCMFTDGLVNHFNRCHFLRGIGGASKAVVRTGWNATYWNNCYFNAHGGTDSGKPKGTVILVQQVDNRTECVHHEFIGNTIEVGDIRIASASSVIIKDNYMEEVNIYIDGTPTSHTSPTEVDDIRIVDNHVVEAVPSIQIDNVTRYASISILRNDTSFSVRLNVKDKTGIVSDILPIYNFPDIEIDNFTKREDPIIINGVYKMEAIKCQLAQKQGDQGLRRVKFTGLNLVTTNDTPVDIMKLGYQDISNKVVQGMQIEERTICYRTPNQGGKFLGSLTAIGHAEFTTSSKDTKRYDPTELVTSIDMSDTSSPKPVSTKRSRNPYGVSVDYTTDDYGTKVTVKGEANLSNQWSMDLSLIYIES